MDAESCRKEIIERINAEYDDESGRAESFLSEIAESLCNLEQCDGFSPCHFDGTGPGNRKVSIDGYYFDEDNRLGGSLSIFCCKYTGGETPGVLTKTEIEKIFNRAKLFVTSAFDSSAAKFMERGSPPCCAAKRMHDVRDDILGFRFYIITDDVLTERAKDLNIEFIDGKSTQIFVWDSNRYYSELISKRSIQDTEIELENYGYDGINCLKANEISGGAKYDAYLCVMPGKLLAEIYAKYGNQLLESNVRSFLSLKGKVNRGIRDTIRKEPSSFFAYNNGISTTATNLTVAQTPDGLKITKIKSLQIVNGGQTTASIYNATVGKNPTDVSEVFVPMKICVIPADSPDSLTRCISEYSNNQNKVGKSDFFSNSPFHIKIEQISRRLSAPPAPGSVYTTKWYYERARGSYTQEMLGKSAAEVNKFEKENPKSQLITKTDFARYRNALELRPYDVSKAPETNFVKFGVEADRLWNSTKDSPGAEVNDRYFKKTVGVAILYKAFADMLRDKSLIPGMMSGEAKCLTAYSISKLILTLNQKKYTLKLEAIWDEQRAPDVLLDQLLDLSKQIRGVLQEEIEGSSKNLFDYCKSENAWNLIKQMEVELHGDLGKYVIKSGSEKSAVCAARRAENDTTMIKEKSWIVEQGGAFWKTVVEWGVSNKLLSSTDISILRAATDMESNRKPPSDKQSKCILSIYRMLCENGFE